MPSVPLPRGLKIARGCLKKTARNSSQKASTRSRIASAGGPQDLDGLVTLLETPDKLQDLKTGTKSTGSTKSTRSTPVQIAPNRHQLLLKGYQDGFSSPLRDRISPGPSGRPRRQPKEDLREVKKHCLSYTFCSFPSRRKMAYHCSLKLKKRRLRGGPVDSLQEPPDS